VKLLKNVKGGLLPAFSLECGISFSKQFFVILDDFQHTSL